MMWLLQERAGWKSESMARRYAHMSAKHLEPFADRLDVDPDAVVHEDEGKAEVASTPKSPTTAVRPGLRRAAVDRVSR